MVGVDVGGTKSVAVAAAIGPAGIKELVSRRTTDVPGPETLRTLVASVVDDVGNGASIGTEFANGPIPAAVGLGVAGWVDHSGVARRSPHVPTLVDVELSAELGDLLGTRVVVDNDGNCTALAAAAGRDDQSRCLMAITFGTGIGAGLLIDGRVQRGAHGYAGEPGHMVLDPQGPRCDCGQRGCWETYASGPGLAQLAGTAIERGSLVPAAVGGKASPSGEEVIAAARAGDEAARAVVDEFAAWVARGLAAVANTLDPDVIAVGGGLASSADIWLPTVRQILTDNPSIGYRGISIEVIQSPERAGALGAVLLAAATLAPGR